MRKFASPGAFAEFLLTRPLAMALGETSGLEKAGVVIEEQARVELGVYQEKAGPFAAWSELADATQTDRVRQGYTPDDPGLRSGEMAKSIGHEVEDRRLVVGSADPNLLYFELGTSKQPPRSVLGGALVRKEKQAVDLVAKEIAYALAGKVE